MHSGHSQPPMTRLYMATGPHRVWLAQVIPCASQTPLVLVDTLIWTHTRGDVPLLGNLYKFYVPRIRDLPRTVPITDDDLSGDVFRLENHPLRRTRERWDMGLIALPQGKRRDAVDMFNVQFGEME